MDQNPNPYDQFVEHQRKAMDEASKAIDALLPPAFKEHGKAAINEAIEGFKVLLEGTIDGIKQEVNNMGGKKSDEGDTTTGANKVKVELS